jgi:thiosulfate/3-mercaptopyruvate sulfurtransferase
MERLTDAETIIMDCRFDLQAPHQGFAEYLAGHIPGARYVHLDRDLAGPVTPASGRHPLPSAADFIACLRAWGVTPSSRVVAYDGAGGAIAARLWWMLGWIGHERAAVLDGGLKAWLDAGYPVETELPAWEPSDYASSQPHDEQTIGTDDLVEALAHGAVLLDARAQARFDGRVEPIDTVAGHVPGAINLPFQACLDEHGAFLPPERLARQFQACVGGQASEIVAMCGSGVTACHLLLGMELAGLGRGRLYVGSWSEWIRDPTRPIARANAG